MKQKLSLGDFYALTKNKLDQLNIRYLSLLAVGMIMCLYAVKQVSAQVVEPAATAVADIRPLQIGDTIPEWLLHHPLQVVNHPDGKDTITLSDYRNKLIILDFWATWCGSCVTAMPRIDSVQQQFDGKVKVLLVSREAAGKVQPFLHSNHRIRDLSLESVVSDTWLQKAFKHRTVPHYVWIDSDGVLAATTMSNDVTYDNVNALLSGKPAELNEKKDADYSKPYFFPDEGNESAFYSIFIVGRQPGVGVGKNRKRYKNGAVYSRLFINTDLRHLYTNLAMELFRKMGLTYSHKSLVFEINDPPAVYSKLLSADITNASGQLYSYEIVVPPESAEDLPHLMLDDLNRYLPYVAAIERRHTTCLVLRAMDSGGAAKTEGDTPLDELSPNGTGVLRNKPVDVLLYALDNFVDTPFPIVDGTGIGFNIDVTLDLTKGLPEIRKDLAKYGMTLLEEECLRDIFVVNDKQPKI